MADPETIEFLTAERDTILDAALGEVTSRHYAEAGAVEIRRRLESLFDCVVESIEARDLSVIVGHAQQIAEERFRSGYDLSEVQAAFGALEAATWSRVLATLSPDRFARTLGLVTTVLGAGRDVLARTYVSLATDDRAPALDLRALFAGAAA